MRAVARWSDLRFRLFSALDSLDTNRSALVFYEDLRLETCIHQLRPYCLESSLNTMVKLRGNLGSEAKPLQDAPFQVPSSSCSFLLFVHWEVGICSPVATTLPLWRCNAGCERGTLAVLTASQHVLLGKGCASAGGVEQPTL